jgi:hypothetical protein
MYILDILVCEDMRNISRYKNNGKKTSKKKQVNSCMFKTCVTTASRLYGTHGYISSNLC